MEINLEFKNKLESYRTEFEERLKRYVGSLGGIDAKLKESADYSLFSGGKRIRPIIMLAFCDLFGGNRENVYPFACALEMMHTYSLIHDDLPCMDNDTMRRGKPCNHIKFGEDIALLAGDGLLTQAFEAVSDFETDDKLNKNRIRSIKILAECAGMSGMISGQCMDLRINADNISVDKVLELYRLKTAKLFCAASEIGALMSGAGQDEADLTKEYGERIGIVF